MERNTKADLENAVNRRLGLRPDSGSDEHKTIAATGEGS